MSPNTNKHPELIGNAVPGAAVSFRKTADFDGGAATALGCLRLSYSAIPAVGGTPAVNPRYATYTVDGNGAGTQGRLTLSVKNYGTDGSANSDVDFTIDFDGTAKSDWSSGAAVAYSLKELIDLINEDDAGGTSGKLLEGFKAEIGVGGRYDMVLNGASQFSDEAETTILPGGINQDLTECLKRDEDVHTEDSDYLWYWRLGLPDVKDRRPLKLLDLWGAIGTDTGGTVTVVRDDDYDYVAPGGTWATDIANHEVVYEVSAANLPANAGATSNAVNHKPDECPVVRGPLLVIVKADTSGAQTITMNAVLQAAG